MAMVYASLIDSRYLPSAKDSPGPVFQVWARRWQRPTVAIRDVDRLDEADNVMLSQAKEAEEVLQSWKDRRR